MAGLFFIFMFLAFPRRLLGFDRGSQSWIPLLPSELHLGSYLGSLGFQLSFQLSSIWDSILGPLVSIYEFLPAPAAARARSAQGASQFAAGHAAARLASVTTRPQQAQPANH